MSSLMHVQTIAKVTNREYEMIKCFSGTGDFEAVGMAEEFLRNQGYKIGSTSPSPPSWRPRFLPK